MTNTIIRSAAFTTIRDRLVSYADEMGCSKVGDLDDFCDIANVFEDAAEGTGVSLEFSAAHVCEFWNAACDAADVLLAETTRAVVS